MAYGTFRRRYHARMATKHTKRNVLPDWYPLPIYTKELRLAVWLTEIVARMAIQIAKNNHDKGLLKDDPNHSFVEEFLNVVIRGTSRNPDALVESDNAHFWPVRQPTPYETIYLAEIQRDPSYAKAQEWAKQLVNGPISLHGDFALGPCQEIMAIPFKELSEDRIGRLTDVMHRRIPVLVDLDHDDRTLEQAFKIWLIGARDSIREKARHPIGGKEFTRWMRFGLLPAFDLLFWARITGQSYTDVFLAHTIWPDNKAEKDDFADITERFRKVTRPMVEEIFEWPFVAKLWAQVNLEAALDRLVGADRRNGSRAESIPEGE